MDARSGRWCEVRDLSETTRRASLAVHLPLERGRVEDLELAAAHLDESAPLEVGEQLVDGHARRCDRGGEVVLAYRQLAADRLQLEQVAREPTRDIEEGHRLITVLETLDRLGQVMEHPVACLRVALQHLMAGITRELQRRRGDHRDDALVALRVAEERALAEELASPVERHERLVAVLIHE